MKKYWKDLDGIRHKSIQSTNALDFKRPLHKKVRNFVFRRANFTCQLCGVSPEKIPENYDGSGIFYVRDLNGNLVYMVVEHILSRRCGGTNHPDNLQCACETCNRKKIKHDIADFLSLPGNSRKSKTEAGFI